MEKHFLQDMMEGEPEFRAEPWYNPTGDCMVYKMADEAVCADRIDGLLTIYRSAIDNRPVGFQIKGVAAIIKEFGLDGFLVSAEQDAQAVKRISVAALLLAAYEGGPMTLSRRLGYATAIQCPVEKGTISADELQPA